MEDDLLWTSFFILLVSEILYIRQKVCKNTQPKYKQYFGYIVLPNPNPIRGRFVKNGFYVHVSHFLKKQVAILKVLIVSGLVKLMKLRLSIEGCVLLVISKVNS